MRIVVNDIAASKGGALSILMDFYTYVAMNDKDNEWIFLLSDSYIKETENIKVILFDDVKKSWIKKLYFDFFKGRKIISKLKPEKVISLQNIITFGLKVPQVVYIHQSLPFQDIKKFSLLKSNERTFAIYQYFIGAIIKLSARKADKIIVQTKWMKGAVIKKAKIPETKIVNIIPNIDNLSRYKKENKFKPAQFIYPTSDSIYKNNDCIYKACNRLNEEGYANFVVRMTIDSVLTKNNIDFIGNVSREKVIEEYNSSTLIFPSYIETFGYPLEEAKQMGALILASDCNFSREILEGYENAYFFNPFDPKELAELMENILDNRIKRESVSVKINNKNSWADVIQVIREV